MFKILLSQQILFYTQLPILLVLNELDFFTQNIFVQVILVVVAREQRNNLPYNN